MSQDILMVDDDPGSIQLMASILSDVGQLRFATSGEDSLRLAHESVPDLVLLDAEMPGMSGFEVLAAFKADPQLADVPVIIVTSHSEPVFETAGFEKGAADFIAKPLNGSLVRARVQCQLRVKRMADELRRISATDVLTGVANRRRFDEALELEWRHARRSGEPVALLIVDVDHFKAFNDHYGHQAGDTCLVAVAQALGAAVLRPTDLVARYGGDEFVVLLPETGRSGAEHLARRVLDAIEALDMEHEGSSTARRVTVSVGIASHRHDSDCWVPSAADTPATEDASARCAPTDLMQTADKALYSAKKAGRGQACQLATVDAHLQNVAGNLAASARPELATE